MRWFFSPLAFFNQPGSRIYWLYSLLALILALIVYARRGVGARRMGRRLLKPSHWLNASTRLDYQLWLLNAWWKALLLPAGAVASAGVGALLSVLLAKITGFQPQFTANAFTPILFTLSLFLADDYTRYRLHRLMHESPRLWRIHQIHHSAQVLTPITVYRVHPLESLFYYLRAMLAQGMVTGIFFFIYRDSLHAIDILGINLFGFIFNALGANLRHSHVPMRFPKFLEGIFLSPVQHQFHHSKAQRHFDQNYGSFLALWDRWAKTLYIPERDEKTQVGLVDCRHRKGLLASLKAPFQAPASPPKP